MYDTAFLVINYLKIIIMSEIKDHIFQLKHPDERQREKAKKFLMDEMHLFSNEDVSEIILLLSNKVAQGAANEIILKLISVGAFPKELDVELVRLLKDETAQDVTKNILSVGASRWRGLSEQAEKELNQLIEAGVEVAVEVYLAFNDK